MMKNTQEGLQVFKNVPYIKVPQVFAHLSGQLDLTQVRMLYAIACEMQPRINKHFRGSMLGALFSEEELERESVVSFSIPAEMARIRSRGTVSVYRSGMRLTEEPLAYTYRKEMGQRETRQEPIFCGFQWETLQGKKSQKKYKSRRMYFFMRRGVARRLFCSEQGYILVQRSVMEKCHNANTAQIYQFLAGFRSCGSVELRSEVVRMMFGDARWDASRYIINTDLSRPWCRMELLLQRCEQELKAMAMCGDSDLCFSFTAVRDEIHRRLDPQRVRFQLIQGNEPVPVPATVSPEDSTTSRTGVEEKESTLLLADNLTVEQQEAWHRTMENLYRRIDDHAFLHSELTYFGLYRVEGDVAVLCTSSSETRSRWSRERLQILADETCAQLPGVYRIKFEFRENYVPVTLR